ncbi:amidohydrolase family protein [Neorhodopirellula pilleata]|uniref:Imidazolonepropionase n=1 Tax=Neorhodopirellula pilleata TaxID=2714738 RepID=A0A5C6ADQ0_9BACT|nr:amidohydrolase family protein [Neorhodopirellula pilleata]TWT97305.1 imidazolonepropionase [Neorhodopirellula pilleata]
MNPLLRIAVRFSFVWTSVALISNALSAHDQVPGAPQRKPILIHGGTLHIGNGEIVEKGSILLVDGKIQAVGRRVDAPEKAISIDATGQHVYPGLIESMTDLGLREISAVDVTVDSTEWGNENPNVRSWIAVNPDSELIPVARAGGVLLAHVAPGGSFLRGQSALIALDGWTIQDMAVRAPAGMCVDWETLTPRGSDDADTVKKREERLQQLDDWLDRAERYGIAQEEAANTESRAIATDVRLESLLPVLSRELPIIAHADALAAIRSAVAYTQARGLRLVIYGGHDAGDCAELLKRYRIPVIIAGTYRLPRQRDDDYDAPYTLPARLESAGVKFAIAGEQPGYPGGASNARNLPYHAGCAVAYGLDREAAVKAITLSPAEILGVDDRLGSLETGKDATLIIVDGDVLESPSNVQQAFIEGRTVDLGNRHRTLFEKYRRKYSR